MEEPRGLVGQILPKTLAGLAVWILLFAAGVAAAGVILFFWYNFRLEATKREILAQALDFNDQVEEQRKAFEELVKASRAEIEKASGGAGSQAEEVSALLEKVGPAVAHVQGKNATGGGTSGSGFVVVSNDKESWVVTSFALVAGNVAEKSPVTVSVRAERRQANVYSWDQPADLALIIIKLGGLGALAEWAPADVKMGAQVWAVGSAPGQLGAAASQGYLLDVTENGILTDADVPANASGGPLVDREGKPIGILSLTYAPEGYAPSNGWAVPIRLTCRRVLRCP